MNIETVIEQGLRKGSWPVLYRVAKDGVVHTWRCWVKDDMIYSEHGQQDGKLIVSQQRCTGKNEGRSNETSDKDQALKQAAAMVRKRLEQKYSTSVDGAATRPALFPMLAANFQKREGFFSYPVYVQPKLDGCRCLAIPDSDGSYQLFSRKGKVWDALPEIAEAVEELVSKFKSAKPGLILDGELYVHGAGFQKITSWIKRRQPQTAKIQFWIYDVVDLNHPEFNQIDRTTILTQLSTMVDSNRIHIVETGIASKKEQVIAFHDQFVQEGYEGAIVRLPKSTYLFGHRSHGLLKVKMFEDAEFPVVGFKTGKLGTPEEHCIIFICKGSKEFSVRPAATIEERQEMLKQAKKDPNKFVGKQYSVKYQELTEDGVPRFPVGKGFRMMEDM